MITKNVVQIQQQQCAQFVPVFRVRKCSNQWVRTVNTRLEQTKPTAVTVRKLFTENHNKNIKRLLMLYSECEILKEKQRKMNEAVN